MGALLLARAIFLTCLLPLQPVGDPLAPSYGSSNLHTILMPLLSTPEKFSLRHVKSGVSRKTFSMLGNIGSEGMCSL